MMGAAPATASRHPRLANACCGALSVVSVTLVTGPWPVGEADSPLTLGGRQLGSRALPLRVFGVVNVTLRERVIGSEVRSRPHSAAPDAHEAPARRHGPRLALGRRN